jgi:hypothetical protein
MTNKVKDLIVYRAYNYKGVSILVKINFLDKTVTLVEREKGYGQDGFKPKKWLFADRTTEYLTGWEMILDAMKFAINEARKDAHIKALTAIIDQINATIRTDNAEAKKKLEELRDVKPPK